MQTLNQINKITRDSYQGQNAVELMLVALDRGYESNEWLTFLQGKERGFCVKKGEKGTRIVYFQKTVKITSENSTKNSSFCKYFTLFNEDQFVKIDSKENVELV